MSPWWKGLLETDVKAWLTLVVWVDTCQADPAPKHDTDPLSSPPASASPCAARWACHWGGERWTDGREKHELFTDAGGPVLNVLHGACEKVDKSELQMCVCSYWYSLCWLWCWSRLSRLLSSRALLSLDRFWFCSTRCRFSSSKFAFSWVRS